MKGDHLEPEGLKEAGEGWVIVFPLTDALLVRRLLKNRSMTLHSPFMVDGANRVIPCCSYRRFYDGLYHTNHGNMGELALKKRALTVAIEAKGDVGAVVGLLLVHQGIDVNKGGFKE